MVDVFGVSSGFQNFIELDVPEVASHAPGSIFRLQTADILNCLKEDDISTLGFGLYLSIRAPLICCGTEPHNSTATFSAVCYPGPLTYS